MRAEDIPAGRGDGSTEFQPMSLFSLRVWWSHHPQSCRQVTRPLIEGCPPQAQQQCSSICTVSGRKLVPGILMYQIQHLEPTLAQESLSHSPLNVKEADWIRRTHSRFSLPAHQPKTPLAHAFTYFCIYYNKPQLK